MVRLIASGKSAEILGSVLADWIFRSFLFLGRRIISRILSPDFFFSFLWEKVPRKILQENPQQNPPKLIQQKSPPTFCRGVCGKFVEISWTFSDKFRTPSRTTPYWESGGHKGEHLKLGHLEVGFRSEIRTQCCQSALSFRGNCLRSGPGKPNQRKVSSWTFRRGIPEQKFNNVNRACFPKEKKTEFTKMAKFMNFSFWPFLWFGLPGRLLNKLRLI